MEFEPLASSSAGCAYRLSAPGLEPLLIDAGLRFSEIRRALGYTVSGLAACLLSHAHGDHSRGIAGLMEAAVDCWASEECWAELELVSHRAKVLEPLKEVEIGGWRVLAFPCVHDSPGTLGFVIGAGAERLLYITDSMYSPYRFGGLTLVAIECNHSLETMRENAGAGVIDRERYRRTARNHMSLDRCIDMLRANDLSRVRQIYLLHLSGENSDEERFRLEVERATGRPVAVCAERSVAL